MDQTWSIVPLERYLHSTNIGCSNRGFLLHFSVLFVLHPSLPSLPDNSEAINIILYCLHNIGFKCVYYINNSRFIIFSENNILPQCRCISGHFVLCIVFLMHWTPTQLEETLRIMCIICNPYIYIERKMTTCSANFLL